MSYYHHGHWYSSYDEYLDEVLEYRLDAMREGRVEEDKEEEDE